MKLPRPRPCARCVVLAVATAFAATGCAMMGGAESGASGPAATGEERSPLAEEADKLLEVDRAFARRALEVGAPAAFHEYFDERGIQLAASGDPAVGPERVRVTMAAGPPIVLSWEPRYAEVFAPGHWGWTWGDWQAHEPGAGGRRVAQGRYVNLWKKQKDDTWKVRLDMGSAEQPPAPPATP